MVDVIDVKTQQALEMTLQQWVKYFTSEERDEIYNVISLEFSHTKLEDLVDPPKVVSIFFRITGFLCVLNKYFFLFIAGIFFIFIQFPSCDVVVYFTRVVCSRFPSFGCYKMSFNSVIVIFH